LVYFVRVNVDPILERSICEGQLPTPLDVCGQTGVEVSVERTENVLQVTVGYAQICLLDHFVKKSRSHLNGSNMCHLSY
jgi:hypothetical protein